MFTGLVQGTGRLEAKEPRGGETRLNIRALFDLPDLVSGESIAVNGACLTVETFGRGWFTAYASAETLRRTNLGGLRSGSVVNLERALALGERLGGHLVSGHVDCLAEVASIGREGESRVYTLDFPAEHGPFVIEKGSVALDGVSLTVNARTGTSLSVNIIPTTQAETTIANWKPGVKVNMETDLIGKYVRNMLAAWTGQAGQAGQPSGQADAAAPSSGLTLDFLRENGF